MRNSPVLGAPTHPRHSDISTTTWGRTIWMRPSLHPMTHQPPKSAKKTITGMPNIRKLLLARSTESWMTNKNSIPLVLTRYLGSFIHSLALLISLSFLYFCDQQESILSGREGSSAMARNGAYFCCNLCDYCTDNRGHMSKHEQMHSWNEKFKCPRCSYSSKQQSSIDQHLKKDHWKALDVPKEVTNKETAPGHQDDEENPVGSR